MPALGSASLPGNRGFQRPLEQPTDGVLNWPKFVVKDLEHVEHTFVWTGQDYVRQGVLAVGQKVVVGNLASELGKQFNDAAGWVRSRSRRRAG